MSILPESFLSSIARRECGFPGARQAVQQGLDRQIEHNLIEDCFHSDTIELSQNHRHSTFQCLDRVAVLSTNKMGQKMQSLALYSLSTGCKLWEITIDPNYTGTSPGSCSLSESGMVVVHSESAGDIIVLDGKVTGVLPKLNWLSKVAMGNRILICWTERHNNQGPHWTPENSNCFFGEWDKEGKRLSRHLLSNKWSSRHHQYAYSENFWVRLTGGSTCLLPSTIEVADRVTGALKTFKLPLSQYQEQFSSACVNQNQLFYGKNVFSSGPIVYSVICKTAICIYDLVKGVILEEIPIETEEPKCLVASQNYVAWFGCKTRQHHHVRYLDRQKKTVKCATTVPDYTSHSEVILNIFGKALSVASPEGHLLGRRRWHRKVIDLSSGTPECDVRYKRPLGEFSISSRNMLITHLCGNPSSLYIEDFLQGGDSDQEASQRDDTQE